MADALRLALGTFTAVRVRPPTTVDRRTVARALLLVPFVGAAIGGAAGAVLEATRELTHHSLAGRLLAAALAVVTIVVLDRGLHLDGLADTADGLGSRREPAEALAIMRRSDVGPYGVIAIVLVLLVQVTAVAESISRGTGWLGVLGACVAGRTAVVHACVRGVPAARPDGLGAAFAGAVSRGLAWALTLLVALAMGAVSWADDDRGWALTVRAVAAVLVAAVVAVALVGVARRRFGGVSGDVMGAVVEIATTVGILCFALV